MKSAVVVFPGSNCDRDAYTVLARLSRREPLLIWHNETSLPKGLDFILLPGGFSYGDYLRSGAMAARSSIMQEVARFAERGGLVLGVCNGFQVLTESGILPGTLLRNRDLNFICRNVHLRVENAQTAFTRHYQAGQVINVPVAHHDGNYFTDATTLQQLQDRDLIAFRYCDAAGNVTEAANPNGSVGNIAGIFNEGRNVLGMMPHPERHAEQMLGGEDGTGMFTALLEAA